LRVKDGGSMFLRCIGNLPSNYTALYSSRHSPNIRETFMDSKIVCHFSSRPNNENCYDPLRRNLMH
jgi:hypothetical protein